MNVIHKNYSITVLSLLMIVDFCKANHLNIPFQCKVYFNDNFTTLNNIHERIPFKIWCNIIYDIQDQHPIDGLGLYIANHIKLSYGGILSYLILSKPNLLEGLSTYIYYQRLFLDFNVASINIKNNLIELTWSDYYGKAGLLIDELMFAILFNIIKQIASPKQIKLQGISFYYPQPINNILYHKYFKCPVKFNAPINMISMNTFDLKTICSPYKDNILYSILEQKADDLLNKLVFDDEFQPRLQTCITYCIQNKKINIRDVAEHMNMPLKNLKEELNKRDLSYNSILLNIRLNLAKQYLINKDCNISKVADLLGYAEQSVFQRVFKKYTGETPLQYRKRHKR